MNKILEMRAHRAELWDRAKAFLNEHQDEHGMLNADDTATYERMEKELRKGALCYSAEVLSVVPAQVGEQIGDFASIMTALYELGIDPMEQAHEPEA